jgi:Uma2 family endonuclease
MTTAEAGFEERRGGEFLFDFDDFERMDEAGVFRRVDGRVELIEGKIQTMAPISGEHGESSVLVIVALTNALIAAGVKRESLRVVTHASLKIGDHNAPEPDVFVVGPRGDRKYYQESDAVLVAEVSISTRANDLNTKSHVYARAGIAEFWMIEPEHRRLRLFRHPQADGTWASTTVLEGDDAAVTPLFAPRISIPLSDLF